MILKWLMTAAIGASVSGAALAAGDPFDPNYEPPRMADGTPSFEGIWTNASLTVLERADQVPNLVVSEPVAQMIASYWLGRIQEDSKPLDPNAPAPEIGGDTGEGYDTFWIDIGDSVAKIDGEYRSSWIVEPESGKLPWRQDFRANVLGPRFASTQRFDNPEIRSAGERCTVGYGGTGGAPMLNVLYNNHYQFVQTPETVAIHVEMNHNTRLVRIGDEHVPASMPKWLGDSVGEWEGDTLVVETRHFHPGNTLRGAIRHFMYLSPEAEVVERFTRVSDDEILYQFTVDDPDVYTQPWSAEMVFVKADGPIYEYACHEGNYSLPGILAGARREEADAATGGGGAED
jgi:hypothetical protein